MISDSGTHIHQCVVVFGDLERDTAMIRLAGTSSVERAKLSPLKEAQVADSSGLIADHLFTDRERLVRQSKKHHAHWLSDSPIILGPVVRRDFPFCVTNLSIFFSCSCSASGPTLAGSDKLPPAP